MANETLGTQIARLEERVKANHAALDSKLDSLLRSADERMTRAEDDHRSLSRKVDHQGERFGARLDAIEQQQSAWKNRAFGLVAGASAGTGGVVVAILKALGG